MADSWSSKVAWDQLGCASGDSSWEVGELLQLVLAGEDVWGNLIELVLHQDTLWEATVPVAAWMVEALQTGKLGDRLIPARNPSSGRKYAVSKRAFAVWLLSSMAEVTRDAIRSGSTQRSVTIAALVLEALRPGIPLYEAGAKDSDDQIRKATSVLLEALAGDGTGPASDSQYGRRLRAKLGMPLSPPTL